MSSLNKRPAHPRRRRSRPSYPRTMTLGAVALMAACAGVTLGCNTEDGGAETDGEGLHGNFGGTTGNNWGGGGTGGEGQGLGGAFGGVGGSGWAGSGSGGNPTGGSGGAGTGGNQTGGNQTGGAGGS